MIEEVDGFYIAAEVRLLRQVKKGSIVLVEGGSDSRLLERFVDKMRCEIEVAFGKTNVIEALDLLEDEGFEGVLAIVDADFDRILGVTYSLVNLFLTDVHDLDLMIFMSNALDRYVREHQKENKFSINFQGDINTLRARVLYAAMPLALFKLCSLRKDLRLSFKSFRHDDFTQLDLSTDENKVGGALLERSIAGVTIDKLMSWFIQERARDHDLLQVVNGHDVSAMLGISLRDLLASKRREQTWASEVESGLRLTYTEADFWDSQLYALLAGWQKSNPPYRIFSPGPGPA